MCLIKDEILKLLDIHTRKNISHKNLLFVVKDITRSFSAGYRKLGSWHSGQMDNSIAAMEPNWLNIQQICILFPFGSIHHNLFSKTAKKLSQSFDNI